MSKKGRRAEAAQRAPWRPVLAAAAVVALLVAGGFALAALRDRVPDPVVFGDVHGLAVHPEDPRVLFVATHHGLFRGADGEGWTRVGAGQDDLMGFTAHPTDGRVFWSSGHPKDRAEGPNLGLRVSRDGGETWTRLAMPGVDFHALAVSPADPDRLWGVERGQLHRSVDGGATWSSLGPAPGGTVSLAPHPAEPDFLFAAGTRGLLRSDDGGATWEPWSAQPALALAFARGAEDAPAYAADGRTVLRSDDGGRAWGPTGFPADAGTVAFLAPHPSEPDVLFAATYEAAVLRSADGGASWTTLRPPER